MANYYDETEYWRMPGPKVNPYETHEEKIAYYNSIKAQEEYLRILKKRLTKIFEEESDGYVFDTRHSAYRCYFTVTISKNKCKKCKKLFKTLSLMIHPDKCSKDWATRVFSLVNDFYQTNNLEKLKLIRDHYVKYGDFDDEFIHKLVDSTSNSTVDTDTNNTNTTSTTTTTSTNLDDKIKEVEKSISEYTRGFEYVWAYGSLRDCLIPEEELQRRQEKRIEILNEKIKSMKELNESLGL